MLKLTYVTINNPQKVVTIPIECVTGKAVLIKPPDMNHIFVIKQPNYFERHCPALILAIISLKFVHVHIFKTSLS